MVIDESGEVLLTLLAAPVFRVRSARELLGAKMLSSNVYLPFDLESRCQVTSSRGLSLNSCCL